MAVGVVLIFGYSSTSTIPKFVFADSHSHKQHHQQDDTSSAVNASKPLSKPKKIKNLFVEYTDNPVNSPIVFAKPTSKVRDPLSPDTLDIKGQVKNIGTTTVRNLEVSAIIYDHNNQTLGREGEYPYPDDLDVGQSADILKPGQTATFNLQLGGSYGIASDPFTIGLKPTHDIGYIKYHMTWEDVKGTSSTNQAIQNTPKKSQVEHSNTLQIPEKSPSSSVSSSFNTPLQKQQPSSFLTYENPTYGFIIQYPSNWSKTEQPEAGRVVSFDEINKGVQVYIKHDKLPSQYATLTQYVNTLVNQLGNDRKDFSLVEYYPNLTLHNNPAYKVVYLSTKKVGVNIGTHYETMRLWIMKDDNVYTLVYVTQPNLFPQYLPIANNMLKSFKITR
jgi:PsbP